MEKELKTLRYIEYYGANYKNTLWTYYVNLRKNTDIWFPSFDINHLKKLHKEKYISMSMSDTIGWRRVYICGKGREFISAMKTMDKL